MTEGKRRELWDREASLTAQLINSQRTRRKAISASQINPFAKSEAKRRDSISDPALLAAMFGVEVPDPAAERRKKRKRT